jgi:hypothetical protein
MRACHPQKGERQPVLSRTEARAVLMARSRGWDRAPSYFHLVFDYYQCERWHMHHGKHANAMTQFMTA